MKRIYTYLIYRYLKFSTLLLYKYLLHMFHCDAVLII
jgi:hypothetical protein